MDQLMKVTVQQEQEVSKLNAEILVLEKRAVALGVEGLTFDAVEKEVMRLEKENSKMKYRLGILEAAATSTQDDGGMVPIVDTLVSIFSKAIELSFPGVSKSINPLITPSSKPQFGDFQFNSSMNIAQVLKTSGVKVSPRDVAEKLLVNLPKSPLVGKVEIAGPGFINVTLALEFVASEVNKLTSVGVRPPKRNAGSKKKVLVDFSSPNVAKEMHVGHLRSTVIGDCICRLLEFMGHEVLRINHLGDWGTQFGMLIAHLRDVHPDYLVTPPAVADLQAFYRESKKRFDSDAEFKKRAYAAVVALQSWEPSHIEAWKQIVSASEKEFANIYRRLQVQITNRGESFYQSRMNAVVEELKSKKLLEEDEGRFVMFGRLPVPLTVIKSDGGYTYDTSDMAAVKQRVEEERVTWIIYVTDAGQGDHFRTIFDCAEKAGWLDRSIVRVDHVPHGVVLGEDKKKLKTRSGDTVRLKDLLDEGVRRSEEKLIAKGRKEVLSESEWEDARDNVAYSCIKYNDLSHDRVSDYVFSFDKMLEDKGNTAAYLLYMLTRIRSISRGAGVAEEQVKEEANSKELKLDHPKEQKLAKVLVRLPDVLLRVENDLLPHQLCSYVYEVASTFSEFYESCYCVERNPKNPDVILKVNMNRLVLCQATAEVMTTVFDILGLMPVSKM
ncbi:unnamed protein product [Cyprideis torosa]|uniref:Probable arginine--tRNA ligase, cytoplasmic n=1 Tax=Cyprideis torosa TaxID=163714 RepID=A0A7R8WDJ4_9CRUS|nr:unnamed protein product [Cyprideis torosa]CAG0889098.1 unnamed protein product [Cyprideis torosa]